MSWPQGAGKLHPTSQTLALMDAEKAKARNAVIEECAKVAEAQKQDFLSPAYTANQPFGSFSERFACDKVAKAIRALSSHQDK